MSEIDSAMFDLRLGDCLEVMADIPDGSVDLVLTDPPYGTVKGLGDGGGIDHGMAGRTGWDDALEPAAFLEHCNRVLRVNGALILFSQEPYTSRLIIEAHGNIPFSYRMAWLKDHFANALIAKKAPVSYFEDVLVFFKKYDTQRGHPLRDWFYDEWVATGLGWAQTRELLGNGMVSHYFTKGVQFAFPTRQNFDKLRSTGRFFRCYDELKAIDDAFKASVARTFNLPEGQKFKPNVLRYKKDYDGFHPTQKPVALLADLVKTYSNEGDTVLDFTMGSGSTGVACANTGRRFLGIERDPDYYETARLRIEQAHKATNQQQLVGALDGTPVAGGR